MINPEDLESLWVILKLVFITKTAFLSSCSRMHASIHCSFINWLSYRILIYNTLNRLALSVLIAVLNLNWIQREKLLMQFLQFMFPKFGKSHQVAGLYYNDY